MEPISMASPIVDPEQLDHELKRRSAEVIRVSEDLQREIAERKKIEEALRETEGRYQLVAKATREAVWDWNLFGGEVWRNEGFQTLFGYAPEEIVPHPDWWSERLHPDDRDRILSAVPPRISGETPHFAHEYRFRRADGSYAHVLDRAYVLTNAAGLPVRMIGSMKDITERKQAEEKLRDYTERLKALSSRLLEAQEIERRWLARELHDEIGQLLTALLLHLDICLRSPPESVQAKLEEALTISRDLMARVRKMSLELRPTMLDDLGILHPLLWHIENFFSRTGIAVHFKHSGVEGRFPRDCETGIYRIVQEGLNNVARHAGVGEAWVTLWADAETLNVQIEDRGRGFEVSGVRAGGAGAGLAGMQERAAFLGGKLLVESSPGQGTRVTASLPLGDRS
jgi:two-component system, NarL family, sensor histidine kinase UhpB